MSRHYELVLMIDPEVADEARESLAGEVKSTIEQSGTLDHADNWGVRKMAYEIKRRNEADYRYFRFQAENELLTKLDHSLKIADGALRFRIFRVEADTPTGAPPVSERPSQVGDGRPERSDRGSRRGRDD